MFDFHFREEMEEVLLRFSLLAKEIFNKLDNESLTRCRKVCKFWKTFLDNNQILWLRIIKSYEKNQVTFKEDWNSTLKRSAYYTLFVELDK